MKLPRNILLWLLVIILPINIYLAFHYAPQEKTMGIVQRVFYFHVASAWIGLLAFIVVFITSVIYLKTRQRKVNDLSLASAELGILFLTCTIITGPLWAYPIWNTWWTWDPRLTTTLVLWFMFLAYLALQGGGMSENRRRLAAVYGIIASINVPLVFFSARWWRSIHPIIVSSQGIGLTGKMRLAMFASLLTFSVLYLYLLQLRVTTLRLKTQVDDLKITGLQ